MSLPEHKEQTKLECLKQRREVLKAELIAMNFDDNYELSAKQYREICQQLKDAKADFVNVSKHYAKVSEERDSLKDQVGLLKDKLDLITELLGEIKGSPSEELTRRVFNIAAWRQQ